MTDVVEVFTEGVALVEVIDSSSVGTVVVLQDSQASVVDVVERGPKGDSGAVASISTDPDNRLTTGSDDGLYVPELVADPLAYYILAKA